MIDLNELLELAANEAAGAQAPTYSAIAKELLHYEIMLAISRGEVAPRIAFQGGTALRLCYGHQGKLKENKNQSKGSQIDAQRARP